LWNRHKAGTKGDEWLPFDFEVPEYDTDWAIARNTGYKKNDLTVLGWMTVAPPMSQKSRFVSPPPSPEIGYFETARLPLASGPNRAVWRKRGRRHDDDDDDGDETDSESTRTVKFPKYYTVSEVGNHIFQDSTWVVEPDGNLGYDVYRITSQSANRKTARLCACVLMNIAEMCQKMGYSTARRIRSQLLTVGPHGPMLRSDGNEHAAEIRAELGKSIRPIGKLLLYQRYQEIAEYNGKNSMPLWIPVGTDVYDVTSESRLGRVWT
jgi:hypothetical protein